VPVGKRTRELEREYRAIVEEILELRGDDGRISAFLRAIGEPGALADSAGYSPNLTYEQKVELLRTLDVTERLELAVKLQRESLAELQVRKRIREDVQEGAEKQQREYFLRKQMESIRKELGDDDASVVDEYRAKIEEAKMPEAVEEQALKELGRLERMGEQTGESSMIRTYLDWLIAVPWSKRSEEHIDPVGARAVLDADHGVGRLLASVGRRPRAEGHGRSEGGEDGEWSGTGGEVLRIDVGAEVDPPSPGGVDLGHGLQHLVALVGVEREDDGSPGHGAVVARSGAQSATAPSPPPRPRGTAVSSTTGAGPPGGR